jgi:Cysteine-rich secretory protein family/LysM domain
MSVKNRLVQVALVLGMLLLVLFASSGRGNAQAGDPYALIDAVNNLRSANGLPALQVDGILMAIAQGHSDYQAAIGVVTHTGAGGTRPRDRAAAAGYGGGATFFISENIGGGTYLTVEEVISWWMGDDPHIQTMLGANYRDIGAGVATAGDFVYYTIDVAYVAGGNYSPPGAGTPIAIPTGGPTAIPIYQLQTAVPNEDGSIVHIVRYGQTLIGIAIAYGVTVNEIKELNYLTSDVIYEGDKLTIQRAGTPAPTASPTASSTPTRAATATRNPTRTPTRTPVPTTTSEATPASVAGVETAGANPDMVGNILLVAIVSLAGGGIILMIVGSFLKRRPAG